MEQKFYKFQKFKGLFAFLMLFWSISFTQIQGQNTALDFDGMNDYVANTSPTTVTGSFTVEAWVNPAHPTNALNIVGSRAPVSTGFDMKLQNGNLIHGDIGNGSSWITTSADAGFNYSVGTWYHIAYVVTPTGYTIYVNGTQEASGSYGMSTPVLTNANHNLYVGTTNGGTEFFQGIIDEVRIWDTERTATEIQDNYETELTGSESGLVAYYNFKEGIPDGDNSGLSTPQVIDRTGNCNDGTLNNFNNLGGGTSSNYVGGNSGITQVTQLSPAEISVNFQSSEVTGTLDLGGLTNGESHTFTYTIGNAGEQSLSLTGSTIVNKTSGDAEITITTQPSITSIEGTSNTTFEVTVDFTSASLGDTPSASFEILNSDCDEGTYTFTINAQAINETPSGSGGNTTNFGGSGAIRVNNLPNISGTFTVEAWVKPSTTSANLGIIGSRIPSEYGFDMKLQNGNLVHGDIGNGSSWLTTVADANFNYSVDTWYHIAYVVTPAGYTVYVNGENEGSGTYSGTPVLTSANHDLLIGDTGFGIEYFQGSIDEVRIWDDARTQNEIRQKMHLTLDGTEGNLVAYYQLDGASVADKIGGYNGSVTGSGITAGTDPDLAVADGMSRIVSVTSSSAGTNEVDFSDTKVAIDFGSTNPNGDLVIYQLNESPINPPTTESLTSNYWIVRNFGTNNSGLDIQKMTFELSNTAHIADSDDDDIFTAYKRGSVSTGAWGETATSTAKDGNSKQIEFNAPGFTGFSQFIIGIPSGTTTNSDGSAIQSNLENGSTIGLPITLLKFNGQRANEREVLLTWATALEKDNTGFEIEMSTDGKNFQKLGFVAGAGNSSEVISYQFLVNNSNSGYYRLKQIDFEGSFEYSELRFVEGVEITRILKISPNPTNGKVVLSLSPLAPKGGTNSIAPLGNEGLILRLLDSKGQAILDTEGTLYQINEHLNNTLGSASKGLYFLELQSETERFIERIILQ